MADERLRIALPYRSSSPHSLAVRQAVADAMRPAVSHSVTAQPPGRATVAAGADEPERDASHSLDAQKVGVLPDANAADHNGVHAESVGNDPVAHERERLARLARWHRP